MATCSLYLNLIENFLWHCQEACLRNQWETSIQKWILRINVIYLSLLKLTSFDVMQLQERMEIISVNDISFLLIFSWAVLSFLAINCWLVSYWIPIFYPYIFSRNYFLRRLNKQWNSFEKNIQIYSIDCDLRFWKRIFDYPIRFIIIAILLTCTECSNTVCMYLCTCKHIHTLWKSVFSR